MVKQSVRSQIARTLEGVLAVVPAMACPASRQAPVDAATTGLLSTHLPCCWTASYRSLIDLYLESPAPGLSCSAPTQEISKDRQIMVALKGGLEALDSEQGGTEEYL